MNPAPTPEVATIDPTIEAADPTVAATNATDDKGNN